MTRGSAGTGTPTSTPGSAHRRRRHTLERAGPRPLHECEPGRHGACAGAQGQCPRLRARADLNGRQGAREEVITYAI